jgi:hypothetical protein
MNSRNQQEVTKGRVVENVLHDSLPTHKNLDEFRSVIINNGNKIATGLSTALGKGMELLSSAFFSKVEQNEGVFKAGMSESAETIQATKELQTAINKWLELTGQNFKDSRTGQSKSTLDVNGKYDADTINVVSMFQSQHRITDQGVVIKNNDARYGLLVDGKAGIRTMYALQTVLEQTPISFEQLKQKTHGVFDASHVNNGNLASLSDDPEDSRNAQMQDVVNGPGQPMSNKPGKEMLAHGTVYHRHNSTLEGGLYTGLGKNNPLYTVEDYKKGKVSWVSCAVDPSGPIKLRQFFWATLPGHGRILCRAEDTGGAIKQSKTSGGRVRLDFCLDDDPNNEGMGHFDARIEFVSGEDQQKYSAIANRERKGG